MNLGQNSPTQCQAVLAGNVSLSNVQDRRITRTSGRRTEIEIDVSVRIREVPHVIYRGSGGRSSPWCL